MSLDTPSSHFFPTTEEVTFKAVTSSDASSTRHLPMKMARLISMVGLGAALLLPLNACDSLGETVPCPVPTESSSPVEDDTPTVSCTTSNGSHYLWIRNRGGWVPSDDGVNPRPGARGVGGDGGNGSHGGTGEGGHGGVGGEGGHGGGEGG
ncbi:hypothetical protein [Ktedonospora formicarum]|uniref:Uncharacterized protein n=1 Tax=Ktedonospora formicarum TaxID=2778364 RepID=A0A8J3MP38_9CHLR|nr:hypothetical protein [Ktedonospora formicarum]GHO43437.1 hypothetical protein KSX_16000 [Ktedonospora formicarum]